MSDSNEGTRLDLSRRDALRFGLGGAVAVTASGLLVGCSSGGGTSAKSVAHAGPPKKGGTLTVGVITAGSAETLDPWNFMATPGYVRAINLYDTLFQYEEDLSVRPALAESYEVSPDKKTWTIRLRKGVTFHDGSAFGADDVIHNVQAWVNPNTWPSSVGGRLIDARKSGKIDDHTVRIVLVTPNARLDVMLAFLSFGVKSRNQKKGGKPIGTGPFKFVSFTPGSRSEFERFENHWRSEPVYLDRLVVDSSFADDNARTNAFKSGQLDLAPMVDFSLAKTIPSATASLLRAKSGAFNNLYMAVDQAPFNDVNVRQAMRLLVDRKQMVEVTYGDFGRVSNDVPGRYTPFYDDSLVRERDVAQAKSLLKKAGKDGMTVTLQTSAIGGGVTQAATLFKQQARDAGVTVKLQQIDPATYWAKYTKWSFAQNLYYPVPSMDFVWLNSIVPATNNETHWTAAPSFARTKTLFEESLKSTDKSKLAEIWQELQKQQFDDGGYINYGTYDYIDAINNKVQGLTPSKYFCASGCNFRKAWLTT